MADRLDVAERLTEGQPAVEHTQSYVQACHALGYQHPDLTSHPSQIRDWYESETGLDLRALDRDCAELRAAGAAVMEALRMQCDQVAELAAAWTGPGGDSAVRALQRHCDAGNTAATELRAAAQRCESLRDNLWYLVDSKVATAIAIDDRTQAQRQAWLAAAAAITTGTGDRPSAEEAVRHQVMPYVDNDIRNDWLTAMRSTSDGVATSYDMVIDRMAAAPPACFEFPGDLGPGYGPSQPTPPRAPIPAAVVPAAATPGLPVDPAPDFGTALGEASGMPAGDPRGGLSGLVGLASRIVNAMGDLVGSAADQLGTADPLDEDPFDEDPFHPDDENDVDDDKPDEPEETQGAEGTEEAKSGQEVQPVDTPTPADGAPPPAYEPAPVATPAPADAPPTGEPVPSSGEGSTPCEIAADQVPQAGQ